MYVPAPPDAAMDAVPVDAPQPVPVAEGVAVIALGEVIVTEEVLVIPVPSVTVTV